MPPSSPEIIVIAGPNGAGKKTCAIVLLPETLHIEHFVNADLIARGLPPFAPERAVFAAGRIMLQRIHELRARGESFAFETTLATRSYARLLREAQSCGYRIHMHFVALCSAELARQRVADRVEQGGHDVPVEVIIRRFDRGLRCFFSDYREQVDTWTPFDNSSIELRRVADGGRSGPATVHDAALYNVIKAVAQNARQ